MEQINISELRANLLNYLKQAQSGRPFTVTSNGQVLATICAPDALQKHAKKTLTQVGKTAIANDILRPIGEQWESQQ